MGIFKKSELYLTNEDNQLRFRIVLGLINATNTKQKECDYSIFEGDAINETLSVAVNQIF